jgi:L-fuculose-phosphate aldolase
MENTDAFCQTVSITMQIGGPKQYGPDKLKELIVLRKKLGMPDHRLDELKECELCDAADYTVTTAPQPAACSCELPAAPNAPVDEALVQKITDIIMEKMK